MTDLKELYSNGVEQCVEGSEIVADTPVMLTGTVEDLLAKHLIDFAIEDDTVLGYINDLDTFKEILDKMKDLGFAFSVRDSDARQKQREKIQKVSMNGKSSEGEGVGGGGNELFCHLTVFYQLKAMPIKFFGLPFTIDKTTHYQCAYGCKYYKSRAGSTKMKSENSDFKQAKKKKRVGSKKMGCLAKMTIKHITVYPEYKLDVESDWRKKKKLIENLRRDLSDTNKIVKQFQRFYLSVSVQSSHNHPPIIVRPKPKASKPKSHRILVRSNKIKRSGKKETAEVATTATTVPTTATPATPTVVTDNDWGYIELASSSLTVDRESRDEDLPGKTLNLRDENFFHTLVKFPNATSTVFEQVEYKPNEIEVEIKPYETVETTSTIEVYEYQPTIQDLQTLFKEKLKNLYTLCTNCSNGSLILRLAGDLEQVEMQLSNDVNYSTL